MTTFLGTVSLCTDTICKKMTAGFWFEGCLIYYRPEILRMRYAMNCRSIQKKFSAYQDGELKPREQDEVTRHMQSCRSCREQYAEFDRVWQSLGELEEIHPDPWFYRQVVVKIREPHKQGLLPTLQRVFRFLRVPAFASILLIIGLLAGIHFGNILAQCDFFPFQSDPTSHSQEALLDSLKVFDPAPPGTLAHGYLQMANFREEEPR
jgi:hypothetical protein